MYYALYCLSPMDSALATMEYDHSLDTTEYPSFPRRRRSWISGREFKTAPPNPLVLQRDVKGVLPELLQVPVAVMTKRLLQVFNELGVSNLQTYPVEIHDNRGRLVSDEYVAFNVVGFVTADALMAEATLKVARLQESANVLLVDDSVMKAILDAGITTLTFVEPSELAMV